LPVIVARPSVARRLPTSNARLGIARFGELFGPGDRNENHIIPATLSEHFGTLRPMIPLSGPQTDFVFVKDAARACLQLGDLLTDVAQPRIVDMPFRSGWECSDRVMAGMVREVLAGREELQPFPSPTTNPLDWSPQFSLRVALKQTADWMREHCDSTIGQDADFPSGYRSAA
jgi:nucleoside-diphosphate-sugar epimerase